MTSLSSLFRRLQKHVRFTVQYLLFCLRYPAMRRKTGATMQSDTLIVSLTDWPERLKMDGVIARALQEEGTLPVVLTNRSFPWSQRYFRAFGVTEFIFLDDLMAEAEKGHDPEEAQRILAGITTFDAMYRFRSGEVNTGRHVLSTIVRQLKQGSASFHDPQVAAFLRKFFPQSLTAARAAETLFAARPFKNVLFVEKGYTPYAEFFDVALNHHANVVQFHHGHRSELIVMKRYTDSNRYQHSSSLSRQSWERVLKMPWSQEQEDAFMQELRTGYEQGTWLNRKFLLADKKLLTPAEVYARLGLDPAKKTAVIFSHVLWDATFFFGKNLFVDYEEWLIETVKAACRNTDVQWVIKVHPDYVWKTRPGETQEPRDVIALAANVGTLPPHIVLVLPSSEISTYSFFAITDYCITVRGTIGIEAPCFGIPVLTAGTGRYSGLGFTCDFETKEEYLHALQHILDIPPLTAQQISLARRHAYALFNLRPLEVRSFEMLPVRLPGGGFDYETTLRVSSPADIRSAPDLQAFTQWVLHSTDEDYLQTASSPS